MKKGKKSNGAQAGADAAAEPQAVPPAVAALAARQPGVATVAPTATAASAAPKRRGRPPKRQPAAAEEDGVQGGKRARKGESDGAWREDEVHRWQLACLTPAAAVTRQCWERITSVAGLQHGLSEFVKLAELVFVMVPGSVEDERRFSALAFVAAHEAAEFLRENPELRVVHSPASVRVMIGRTEAATAGGH
ncbi:hypothetical protein TSOC_000728 [Tetrabaena socialis]|uniref:Uncharacterized protein n=1 Tax=Tetrabaena socialis TaxID=47790 RepID=A0A2J8AII9_9CHLO|nr:hypothetical protein TSOC_000728 [Tetrabaena socialis]|eukprot:PNH12332.1 hypothetical protein TSOC_000728 [Tetrabaena socialis]